MNILIFVLALAVAALIFSFATLEKSLREAKKAAGSHEREREQDPHNSE